MEELSQLEPVMGEMVMAGSPGPGVREEDAAGSASGHQRAPWGGGRPLESSPQRTGLVRGMGMSWTRGLGRGWQPGEGESGSVDQAGGDGPGPREWRGQVVGRDREGVGSSAPEGLTL